jgi:S1-C subfamily serine protease
MKTIIRVLFILSGLALLLSEQPASAQITEEMQDSTVRIITFERDRNDPRLPASDVTQLAGNDILYLYQWGMGTGFVTSKDGCVVTNNHVVATTDESAESHDLVFVLQKAGDKFLLHRAIVDKQDPNSDLAILRVPTLEVKPFEFSPSDPPLKEGDEVFSIGFPGSADASVVHQDLEIRFANELAEKLLKNEETFVENNLPAAVAKFTDDHNGQQPDLKEKEALRQEIRQIYEKKVENLRLENVNSGAAELGYFFHDLDLKIRANSSSDLWDVTDVMNHDLRKGYIAPTVTKGNVERITIKSGWVDSGASIPVVQHNLHMMHGNSGGPLLNGGGQIVGVVGRGTMRLGKGIENTESIDWATSGAFLKTLLDTRHISYITGPGWTRNPLPIPLIFATAIAITIAIAALVIGVIKARYQTSFTTILNEWKTKGGSATELLVRLLEGQGNRKHKTPIPKSKENVKWRLAGRTSGGKTLQIAITEEMFASNGSRLILGRSAELCNLVINDDTVSRQHAEIRKEGTAFQVADRNSSNGTAVNGLFNRNPFQAVSFKPGDTLTLGAVKLDFTKN